MSMFLSMLKGFNGDHQPIAELTPAVIDKTWLSSNPQGLTPDGLLQANFATQKGMFMTWLLK